MSARVLIFADDPEQEPRLYACDKCGSVHSPEIYLATKERKHEVAREAAEDCYQCRTHNECQYCGEQCPKGWTACEPCRFQRKLDAAAEVEDTGGPYFGFDSDQMLWDMAEAQDSDLDWVCPTREEYPHIDPDSVLERVVEEMYEDASVDDLIGVDELYGAIERFNKAQTMRTYWADEKRKIRVPAREEQAA